VHDEPMMGAHEGPPGLVLMGLAHHGVGQWDIALGATEFDG
jgi:hypothetical protein